MIDWIKSAELNRMSIDKLKLWFKKYISSNKDVVVICETCGNERVIGKHNYNTLMYPELCSGCSQKLIHGTPEAREKSSTQATQNYINDPTLGARNSEGQKLAYKNDPNIQDRRTESLRNLYVNDDSLRVVRSELLTKAHKDHHASWDLASEQMRGGNDIIDHHVAYDFLRPEALRVKVTRKFHGAIHHPPGIGIHVRGYSLID